MQARGTAAPHVPLAARVYGLRLLYRPQGRNVAAVTLAVVAVLDYVREAAFDIAQIDHRPLKFDFGQFQRAAQDLSSGRNPYDFFVSLHCQNWCLGGYIYTPLLAELIRPLAFVPLPRAATVWLLLSHLMVLATAVILWRLLRGRTATAAMALMLAAGILFQPLFENLSYVQIGTLLLLILAGAAALHLRDTAGANAGSGALVGLATVFKVTPLLVAPALLPPGWARGGRVDSRLARQAVAGIGGLVACVAALLAAMLLFVPHTGDFFTQVLPHIGGGTTAYENKSFPAMVGRVFDLSNELYGGVSQPDSKLVTVATMALFLGPLLWTAARLAPRAGEEWNARAVSFGAFVAAMPIVSTITWRHHMVVNLLPMALLLPALWPLAGGPASRAGRWLLAASYPLSYIPQDIADHVATSPGIDHHTLLYAGRYLLLEDLNLVGMACLWLACLVTLRGLAHRRTEAEAPATARLQAAARGT